MNLPGAILGVAAAAALFGVSIGAQAAPPLDDATIFAIFDQANSADISTGRLGAKNAHSPDVRRLAVMVVTDHQAVQQMARDLAKKLDVFATPPDNDTSIEEEAKTISLLQRKSGKDFDAAYLQHEIAFHQGVIDAVKSSLLPAIQSDEFRELVRTVLPGFEHHLAETKAVADKLGVAYLEPQQGEDRLTLLHKHP
jgi:putative membrane protein